MAEAKRVKRDSEEAAENVRRAVEDALTLFLLGNEDAAKARLEALPWRDAKDARAKVRAKFVRVPNPGCSERNRMAHLKDLLRARGHGFKYLPGGTPDVPLATVRCPACGLYARLIEWSGWWLYGKLVNGAPECKAKVAA